MWMGPTDNSMMLQNGMSYYRAEDYKLALEQFVSITQNDTALYYFMAPLVMAITAAVRTNLPPPELVPDACTIHDAIFGTIAIPIIPHIGTIRLET